MKFVNKSNPLKERYKQYKERTGLNLSFDDFTQPRIVAQIHRRNVGTVLTHYNKKYHNFEHINHFGLMLFFSYLSQNDIGFDERDTIPCCT